MVGDARRAAGDHHASGSSRCRPSSRARRATSAVHGISEGSSCQRRCQSRGRRQVLGAAAIASLLAAARRERREIRTSSAPMPGGPPNLCAGNGDEIGVRERRSCRRPARNRRAAASRRREHRRGCRSSGWITPVSLLTSWIATSAGPSAQRLLERVEVDQSIAIDLQHLGAGPIAATTASCSVGPMRRRPILARDATIWIASLAPEVRMTS